MAALFVGIGLLCLIFGFAWPWLSPGVGYNFSLIYAAIGSFISAGVMAAVEAVRDNTAKTNRLLEKLLESSPGKGEEGK